MSLEDEYSNKSKEWYEDFERKAYSYTMHLVSLKDHKKVVGVAKTFLRVRKEKIKAHGKDNISKKKLLQLKGIVKTYGLFVKPVSIKTILSYEGVLISAKELEND